MCATRAGCDTVIQDCRGSNVTPAPANSRDPLARAVVACEKGRHRRFEWARYWRGRPASSLLCSIWVLQGWWSACLRACLRAYQQAIASGYPDVFVEADLAGLRPPLTCLDMWNNAGRLTIHNILYVVNRAEVLCLFDRVARTRGSTVQQSYEHKRATAAGLHVSMRTFPLLGWRGKLDMGMGMVWLGRLASVAIRRRSQIGLNVSAQAGHARSGGFGSCGNLEEIVR